ncbi:MAG: MerR family transcriptional regulator [Pseudomonadota bacterium]|jgi:DNA-binding transcriptional MerR regulator
MQQRAPALTHRGLRIGELARRLATTTKTLRFYERIGLIEPAPRSDAAYREYDEHAVEIARLVIGLRQLQLTIPELQAVMHDEAGTTRRQRLLALMDERLRRMELELSVLQGRFDDFSARHAALLATPRTRPPDCVCDALLRPCTCMPGRARFP